MQASRVLVTRKLRWLAARRRDSSGRKRPQIRSSEIQLLWYITHTYHENFQHRYNAKYTAYSSINAHTINSVYTFFLTDIHARTNTWATILDEHVKTASFWRRKSPGERRKQDPSNPTPQHPHKYTTLAQHLQARLRVTTTNMCSHRPYHGTVREKKSETLHMEKTDATTPIRTTSELNVHARKTTMPFYMSVMDRKILVYGRSWSISWQVSTPNNESTYHIPMKKTIDFA